MVSVSLGGRRVRGVVVGVGVEAPAGVAIASAGPVVDRVPGPLVELALWLAEYYGSTPARALALVAPHARARRGERRAPTPRDAFAGEAEPEELDGGPTRGDRADHGSALRRRRSRSPARPDGKRQDGGLPPGLCRRARSRARSNRARPRDRPHAADGRVGSQHASASGIAVLHSALGDAERRDERERIASGEARVVIGARSAVFAPVRDLGLIVVDEEHDSSFKQESDPRYDARTVAAKRAALEGAVAVYGSATPRVESWARLERLELPSRIGAPDADGAARRPAARRPGIRSRRRCSRSSPRWRNGAAARCCS